MDLSKSLKGSQGPFGPAGNRRFPPDFGAVVAHRTVVSVTEIEQSLRDWLSVPLVVCSNHTSQRGVGSLIFGKQASRACHLVKNGRKGDRTAALP